MIKEAKGTYLGDIALKMLETNISVEDFAEIEGRGKVLFLSFGDKTNLSEWFTIQETDNFIAISSLLPVLNKKIEQICGRYDKKEWTVDEVCKYIITKTK